MNVSAFSPELDLKILYKNILVASARLKDNTEACTSFKQGSDLAISVVSKVLLQQKNLLDQQYSRRPDKETLEDLISESVVRRKINFLYQVASNLNRRKLGFLRFARACLRCDVRIRFVTRAKRARRLKLQRRCIF